MVGWIKLHRKIEESWIVDEPEALALWVRILMDANFKDSRHMFNGQLIEVKRGQLIFGRSAYAKKTKISESKIRRYLKLFKSDQMIDQLTTSRYSVITVLSYDQHQANDQPDDQPTTSRAPADDQPTTTLKEGKKEKTVKNTDIGTLVAVAPRKPKKVFVKPELNEVAFYFQEIGSLTCNDDAGDFFDYYTSNGWKVSKNPMKDWKATVRRWLKQKKERATSRPNGQYKSTNEKAAELAAFTERLDSPEDLEF